MSWGALVKTVAKGAIKKKAKKKGAEMAKNIINKKEESKQSAIVVREKSTSLIPISKVDGEEDSSIQKSKSSSSPLERIRSTLLDIIEILKKRRKLVLNKSRKDRVQADKIKKGKREGLLEKMKAGGKKMLGNVKAAAIGWWERLQRFLLMTMLGALVLSIKNNWEAIQEKIKETVEFVKQLWENLEPILTPIWNILKWITVKGLELIKPLFGISKESKEIEQGTDEVSKGLEEVKKKTSWIEGLFKKSKEDTEKLKDEDYSGEFKKIEKMESGDEENPGEDIKKVEQTVADAKDKIAKIELDLPEYETGAVPVPETGPAVVHKGEVIIPAPIVKMAGGAMNIENMINMMQSSTTNIKQNPLKVISIMEGMAKEFAPMGEQLPAMINETISESKIGGAPDKILEKMENTFTTLKEQTDYEDPSATTVLVPVPTPSQPSMSSGGGGGTKFIPVGESNKEALNRYISAVIQKALY